MNKNMPAWAGVVLAVGGLLSGAGVMWTQIEETFPALFASDTSYYEEYANHFDEVPIHTNTISYPGVGEVVVAMYESDGCILITAPGREPTWLTRNALGFGVPGSGLDLVMPALALADLLPIERFLSAAGTQGDIVEAGVIEMPTLTGVGILDDPPCLTEGCQDPHRGEFEIHYGDPRTIDGVRWTPVYRLFEDGCEHYQLRREDGLWDIDENGHPQVCWIDCRHQGDADEKSEG